MYIYNTYILPTHRERVDQRDLAPVVEPDVVQPLHRLVLVPLALQAVGTPMHKAGLPKQMGRLVSWLGGWVTTNTE